MRKTEAAPSEVELLVLAQREQSVVIGLLAEAIDRLAASNEALVESLMADVEQGDDEDQPTHDMAGRLIESH